MSESKTKQATIAPGDNIVSSAPHDKKKRFSRRQWMISGMVLALVLVGLFAWHVHSANSIPLTKNNQAASANEKAQLQTVASDTTPEQKGEDYGTLADSYLAQNDTKDAIAADLKANAVDPNNVDILSSLTSMYYSQKDKANTVKYGQEAVVAAKKAGSTYAANVTLLEQTVQNAQAGKFVTPGNGGNE